MSNKNYYNPVVFLLEDVADMQRCNFVYSNNERCKRDGKYRIGQSIFLCGYHMPGVGRRKNDMKPVVIRSSVDLPEGHSGSSLECTHPFCVAERNAMGSEPAPAAKE